MIKAENLSVHYGVVEAVAGVDFDARDGEVTGLVGPNGSGKSTMLKAIGASVRRTGGRVTVGSGTGGWVTVGGNGADADGAAGRMDGRGMDSVDGTADGTGSPGGPGGNGSTGGIAGTGGRPAVNGSDGEDVEDLRPKERARRLAVVAQEEHAEFPLTAWESVLLGRSVHRGGWNSYTAEDRAVALKAMRQCGIEELADRPLSALSGGERQRALIARALAQAATHLLLDEPTNHLDVRYQHEILTLVAGLGLCTVAVLHDLNLAARYCDRLVLLDGGKVVAEGTPEEVLRPEIIEPVYRIAVERIDIEGVPQLLFRPLG